MRLRTLIAFNLCLLGCDPDDDQPAWSVPLMELDAALFSVDGTSADDVWAVGADPGDGPYVLRWDGTQWERIATGASGDLWWVDAGAERVWMSGDGGLVLRHDRASGATEIVPTPTDLILFGVFEVAIDDVWAVGGDPHEQTGVVLRFDGTDWSELEVPDEAASGSFFKVWGPAPDDVWIVGYGGSALHFDGQGLSAVPVPQGRPLLTVHGSGQDIVAVGGYGNGLVVDVQPDALVDRTPPAAPQFNGVFVAQGSAWAAGNQGALWERRGDEWTAHEDAPRLPLDYHAVFVDPDQGVWAVGGNIVAPPYRRGVLTYFGMDEIRGGWMP